MNNVTLLAGYKIHCPAIIYCYVYYDIPLILVPFSYSCDLVLWPDPHTWREGLVNFASRVCEQYATFFGM